MTAENDLGHTSDTAGNNISTSQRQQTKPNYLSDEEDLEYKVDAALIAICEFEAEETAICSIFAVNLKQEINKLKLKHLNSPNCEISKLKQKHMNSPKTHKLGHMGKSAVQSKLRKIPQSGVYLKPTLGLFGL